MGNPRVHDLAPGNCDYISKTKDGHEIYHCTCNCCGVKYIAYELDTPTPPGVEEVYMEDVALYHGYYTRIFSPSPFIKSSEEVPMDPTLIRYDRAAEISKYLLSPRGLPNKLSLSPKYIMIHVDGACVHNGNPVLASAAYGVYFGPDSRFNDYGCLPDYQFRQTNQCAEIVSCLVALTITEELVIPSLSSNPQIKEVVLVTDSDFVVRSMAEWIWKWIGNGFQTNKGNTVENMDVLLALHNKIVSFEEELGINVTLWWVPRKFNTAADGLANRALNEGRESMWIQHIYDI